MRVFSRGGNQEFALDDADSGEGLAVFFSQNGEATARWRVEVKAIIDIGAYDVGTFYISPPLATAIPGLLSRMVAGALVPGATGWRVNVSAVPLLDGSIPQDESADIQLSSSKCSAQNVGVQRVGERYVYISGTGNGNFLVQAGMRITGIAAVGLTGGGDLTIGSGTPVVVAEGIGVGLDPAVSIPYNSQIAFTNVDWVIEYVESA